jgi:hypothetical protein
MDAKSARELLSDAATRVANYLEGLLDRPVGASHEAVEKLTRLLIDPLPKYGSSPKEVQFPHL